MKRQLRVKKKEEKQKDERDEEIRNTIVRPIDPKSQTVILYDWLGALIWRHARARPEASKASSS